MSLHVLSCLFSPDSYLNLGQYELNCRPKIKRYVSGTGKLDETVKVTYLSQLSWRQRGLRDMLCHRGSHSVATNELTIVPQDNVILSERVPSFVTESSDIFLTFTKQ